MVSRNNYVFLYFMLAWPSSTTDLDTLDADFINEENWMYRNVKRPSNEDSLCQQTHPTNRDIIKRIHAILPFFDKDHSNSEFLHKFRASVYAMSEGEDLLDREAAFYAAVLTPLVFLQNYRDSWCLLQRFHRALRLYQISHPTEKRSALKLLQNFRAVNHKVLIKIITTLVVLYTHDNFAMATTKSANRILLLLSSDVADTRSTLLVVTIVWELPGLSSSRTTTEALDFGVEELHEKKDIIYIKELIKNLG